MMFVVLNQNLQYFDKRQVKQKYKVNKLLLLLHCLQASLHI